MFCMTRIWQTDDEVCRYNLSYSVALAAVRGLENMFLIYDYYEVQADIHLVEYNEDRPDGYIIVLQYDDQAS